MKKTVIGTAVAVVIAGVAYYTLLSDEPPIRVRNGSIEIHAGVEDKKPWQWKAEDDGDSDETDPSFSHEPDHLHFELGKDLWVKVVAAGSPGADTYECTDNQMTGTAKLVFVDFTSGTSTVNGKFRRSRSGIVNQRTKVRPKGAFTLDGSILKSAGDGFVTRVRAGSLDCSFKKKDNLDTIYICMSASDGDCK